MATLTMRCSHVSMRSPSPIGKCSKNTCIMLEEAKKRDHKILGPKLDLFSLNEEAPGMPFIHPKGHVYLESASRLYSRTAG